MFKKLALLSAAAAFAAPMAALSAQPISLDAYYVADSTFDIDGVGEDDGDGFGGRITVPFEGSGVRIHGEYQSTELDDTEIEFDQLRLGASFMTQGSARFGVVGEYVNATIDIPFLDEFEGDGYGVHGRGEFNPSEQFLLYAQLGYVSISDSGSDLEGMEYLIGAVFNINPTFGIGIDYRSTELEDDANDEATLEDLRVGIRVNFGV